MPAPSFHLDKAFLRRLLHVHAFPGVNISASLSLYKRRQRIHGAKASCQLTPRIPRIPGVTPNGRRAGCIPYIRDSSPLTSPWKGVPPPGSGHGVQTKLPGQAACMTCAYLSRAVRRAFRLTVNLVVRARSFFV